MEFNNKNSLSRREMLKIGAGLLAGTAMPDMPFTQMLPVVARAAAQAGVMHLYIAHDDHTDYFWEATADIYVNVLHEILVENLDLIDASSSEPLAHQHKFNCDGTLWVWNYEKEYPNNPEYLTRLINRIRDGHISLPLNALCVCLGGTPAEGVLRGMYYAGSLERRFNLDIDLVYVVENQTLPYGIGALWAGSGAKYSWRGICGCQSKIDFNAGLTRQNEIYWWTGPDGSRILMKWYSFYGLQNLGGYSEAYHVNGTGTSDNTIPRLEQKILGLSQDGTDPYPFSIAGAFGYGWDYLHRPLPAQSFVNIAKNNTNATRKVYVSNELDFFKHFETEYGNDVAPAETVIPTEALAFGNEWEQFQASMVEVTASVLRSIEKLRPAEAMATLVSLKNPTFMDSRKEQRDLAWMNLGLYWEHNWTANGNIAKGVRADWQRETATQINSYVNTLHNDAAAALGGMIQKSGSATRFFAFNPLSWARTDYVDYPYPAPNSTSVYAFDLTANKAVPSQIVTIDGVRYLRAWVEDIPAVGYKVLEIRSGTAPGIPAVTLTANAGTGIIENSVYRITVNTRGAITSLIDKTRGDREFARAYSSRQTNDLLINNVLENVGGSLAVTNAGPVSITLTATPNSARDRTASITLFRDSNRIDIRNRITENFSEVLHWHFGFNLTNPDVMHEEVGAIIRAKYEVNGGQYSSLSKNGRYDGLTLAHFADMTGSEGVGVTLSTVDLQYMKLGSSTSKLLDTANAAISVLAGGQIDGPGLGIVAQDGDTQFLQRFGLQTHGAYDQVNAMKFGLEYQNPIAAGILTAGGTAYPSTQFSLINATNPNVLLWSLKPAEDGMSAGIVTRWWNIASANQNLSFSMPNAPITSARRVSHIETNIGSASVSGGSLNASLKSQQMATYLLKNSAGGSLPAVPVLVAPLDGAQTPSGQPVLSWSPAANATRYELQLKSGSAPSGSDPVIPVTGVSYTPATSLLVGQNYFWRVRAANSSNALSEWSETRDFIVTSSANAAPNRNYYRVKRPTLRWLPITWALGYEVQIATNNTFTTGLITGTRPAGSDSYTPSVDLANGVWFWRVRAKKTTAPDTWGNWSAPEQFVIESP